MNENFYKKHELELILFSGEDVVVTSGDGLSMGSVRSTYSLTGSLDDGSTIIEEDVGYYSNPFDY